MCAGFLYSDYNQQRGTVAHLQNVKQQWWPLKRDTKGAFMRQTDQREFLENKMISYIAEKPQ
jgi:hypothetical protein